ncbi:MAG: hypothetical protein R6V53_04850 [Candidatus Woesearchaeota archaeon]
MGEDYLILEIEEKPFVSKEGHFLQFRLAARDNTLTGICWEPAKLEMQPERGMVVSIEGVLREHPEFGNQLIIHSLKKGEGPVDEFLPSSRRDREEMLSELREALEAIGNKQIRDFMHTIMDDDLMDRFSRAPASIHYYNYRSGLLEHTLNVMNLSLTIAKRESLDCDLIRAGSVLSGLGRAVAYDLKGIPELSEEGGLLGHSVLADRIIQKHIDNIPHELALKLNHMAIARKGKFPEAAVLVSARICDIQVSDSISDKRGHLK